MVFFEVQKCLIWRNIIYLWYYIIILTIVKAIVLPVVMYGCESWTTKKTKHRRIDAFELWCWRRLLRVLWTARKSNQSILKEINPEYSMERLMLKLKLQYFGHLTQRTDSLEKALMLGKIEAGGEGDDREWDGWMALPTRWIWVWASSRSWCWTGKPGVLQSTTSQIVRPYWATELNWTIHLFWINQKHWPILFLQCPCLVWYKGDAGFAEWVLKHFFSSF